MLLLLCAHAAAGSTLLLLPMPLPFIGIVLLGLSLRWHGRRSWPEELRLDRSGGWWLRRSGGSWQPARLTAGRQLPGVISVTVSRYSAVLLADAFEPAEQARLRALLRHRNAAGA